MVSNPPTASEANGPIKAPGVITPVIVGPAKVTPVAKPPTVSVTSKATLTKSSTSKALAISTALPTSQTVTPASASVQATTSIASIAATPPQALKTSATVQVTSTAEATPQSVNASASSCPVKRNPVPQNIKTRNLAVRALTGDEEHQVSLIRFKVGTVKEHWALFFHSTTNNGGSFQGTIVDAIIEDRETPNAVLKTEKEEDKSFAPVSIRSRTDTITPLATVANGPAAQALVDKAFDVKLTQQPPTQNCVDWTNLAMQALSGDISSAVFQPIFDADNGSVRAKTACNFACRAVGEAN
ncbi:hypothetical protein BD410DRAFT_843049 [Rickenella mellea]|uniref:Uncharacterized protein n=1 Tax=Rickenella mellea TaxID=50990 RepID=A0A4Y7PUJ7_9AGAM|nr:hypothetical protein BD410DRAFT_843049 [Rickenella mellea]